MQLLGYFGLLRKQKPSKGKPSAGVCQKEEPYNQNQEARENPTVDENGEQKDSHTKLLWEI